MAPATAVLLALVAAYGVGLEVFTHYVLDPASKVQREFNRELTVARSLQPAPGRPRTVLMVGNSLLEAAVDLNKLDSYLRPDWRAARLFVSDTDYNDWRFGLVRLLDSGARPDAIALMLSPGQLTMDRVRDSYFAHYLMRTSDLIQVARAAHLKRTDTAGLLLARYSLFYAIRAQVRDGVLGKLFPGLPDLLFNLAYTGRVRLDEKAVRRISAERLRELLAITRPYGIPLALLIPPLPAEFRQESDVPVMNSGHSTGVEVLDPVPIGKLPLAAFRDGLHANRQGAVAYTTQLGPELHRWLGAVVAAPLIQAGNAPRVR